MPRGYAKLLDTVLEIRRNSPKHYYYHNPRNLDRSYEIQDQEIFELIGDVYAEIDYARVEFPNLVLKGSGDFIRDWDCYGLWNISHPVVMETFIKEFNVPGATYVDLLGVMVDVLLVPCLGEIVDMSNSFML